MGKGKATLEQVDGDWVEEDFFGERVDGGEDVGKSGRYEQAKGIDIIG